MKKVTFLVLVLINLTSILICQNEEQAPSLEQTLKLVESNLAPKIVLQGEEEFATKPWKLEDRMEFHNIPGVSIAFFEDGKITWKKSYGQITNSSSNPITEQTLFQAASISKPVSAVGILKLVELGKIDLDAPVNNYLKEWKIPDSKFTALRPVTLRDLLSHTSGMNVTGFDGYAEGDTIPTLIEVLDGISPANSEKIKVDTVPGSVFKYSGGGYTIIQKLIEDLTETSFTKYMTENILKPAGMINSHFEQPLPNELKINTAVGHMGNGNCLDGKWNMYPELAAAGLWTTPSDLALFAMDIQKAFHGNEKELLSPNLSKELLKNHRDNWGLGLILIEGENAKWFTHGGSNLGFRSTLLTNIDSGQGVVIMTNGNRGARLYTEILRSISKVYDWDIFKSQMRNVVKVEEEQLKRYIGIYTHLPDDQYQVEVSVEGNLLRMKQLWNNINFLVYPESTSHFFEKEEGVSFNFEIDEKGNPKELRISGDWILTKSK